MEEKKKEIWRLFSLWIGAAADEEEFIRLLWANLSIGTPTGERKEKQDLLGTRGEGGKRSKSEWHQSNFLAEEYKYPR